MFIITDEDLQNVVESELEIAYMAGIPYDVIVKNGYTYLKPITGLNIEELAIGAPSDLLKILKDSTL